MDYQVANVEEIEYYGFSNDVEVSMFYGYAKSNIVGIRYYDGMVSSCFAETTAAICKVVFAF